MAYGLLIAAAYVGADAAAGLAVDEFAPRISFNFTAWGKIFEEVAKFRAGRRLYARMLRERFGARSPKSWMFRSLIGGGGSAFTVQEPENNIVRGAYIALAGALSGGQTMALPTYDEAYTIPSPKAQLIALRTMQICAEESGAADTVDPLAGSYYVETLTNEMEAQDPGRDGRVERMGGIVEAVKSGRHAGRGRAPGLPVRAGDGLRRGSQGRRELPRRRGRAPRPTARSRSTRSIRGGRDPGGEAGPGPPRAGRPRSGGAGPSERRGAGARRTSCRRSWRR